MEEVAWPRHCVLKTISQATVFCSTIPTLAVGHKTAMMHPFSTFVCVFDNTAASFLLKTSFLTKGVVISLKNTTYMFLLDLKWSSGI